MQLRGHCPISLGEDAVLRDYWKMPTVRFECMVSQARLNEFMHVRKQLYKSDSRMMTKKRAIGESSINLECCSKPPLSLFEHQKNTSVPSISPTHFPERLPREVGQNPSSDGTNSQR